MMVRRFLEHRIGMIGLFIVVMIVLVALTAPLLATHDPLAAASAYQTIQLADGQILATTP